MPWTPKSFAKKHNKKLKGAKAAKAARVANAMIEKGEPEGLAIATGNARGEGKPMKKKGDGLRKFAKGLNKRLR